MTAPPYRILILDDDPNICSLLSDFLSTTLRCAITTVKDIRSFWRTLPESPFDLLFLDLRLPDGNGMEVLQQLQSHTPYLPTIVMTGAGSEQLAVQAIRYGAVDYLTKGSFQLDVLPALVEKAVQASKLREQARQYLQQVSYQSLLLGHMRDAIVVWDKNETITYWNEAAEWLYGRCADEMVGQSVAAYLIQFFPHLHPNQTQPGEVERLYIQPGQSPRWISSKLTALVDPHHPS
ncbi:MAG TPA: response regulator, partial [Anaerolineaceae bacterium]|nr:response regulator [Anaerolineaceae bacterium]